ncbi:MAG: hypothetical protein ACM3SM_00410 [Bacteroidota bacterium]
MRKALLVLLLLSTPVFAADTLATKQEIEKCEEKIKAAKEQLQQLKETSLRLEGYIFAQEERKKELQNIKAKTP